MTCGIAGAGKTTLANSIVKQHPQFTNISIDYIIFSAHGIYGIDYPASESLYDRYQDEADTIYLQTFYKLLAENKDIVLERSFYSKQDREDFRLIAKQHGARVVLVFLRAKDKEVLWNRIGTRRLNEKTADSAFDISRETFEMYWDGFEDPEGEGEIIIEVT
ncbi:uncharacterized protein EKO05_0007669 [Ascochyta rabiei]|nr:uncharacterized protein EKO05_0007669 [Ascochyta rabiei]UPX17303.1 hypothetical protein EKO05_0007669 [Ascochyta rabiei]